MRSLYRRLVLSHIAPLLVILPLVGVTLIYVLEREVLLPILSQGLRDQATILAATINTNQTILRDPFEAKDFLERYAPTISSQMMLISADGRLLAIANANRDTPIGQPLTLATLNRALTGEIVTQLTYSQNSQAEVAEVLVPINGNRGVIGVVRLTYPFATVVDRFELIRSTVGLTLLIGLILGGGLGWLIAWDIQRPLKRVTQAINSLAQGTRSEPVPETGPRELTLLAHTFNQLVERLRMLEDARQHLLSNLVHELGRPLGALRSAAQALLRGAINEPDLSTEFLSGMDHEVVRLQRLLDDLTRLHDQILGSLELNDKLIDVQAWLPTVLSPWRAAAEQKDIQWRTSLLASPIFVRGDPDRLAQAVGNLLSNAIKYTPASGSIAIDLTCADAQLTLRICDTGLGVSPDESEHIFEAFYRGSANPRFAQGMGLGLNITRTIIEAHQGSVHAEPNQTQGSCFVVRLPLEQVTPAHAV